MELTEGRSCAGGPLFVGGENMSVWLVIFPSSEFVVWAETILDARKEVEREARKRGLRNRRYYDLYRLGGNANAETL